MKTDDSECVYEPEQITDPTFDILYQKYQNAVFSFACYLTKNRGDAEDLFQEAWLRIVKNMPEKVNMLSIKAWIFTIVANLHRDGLRKKRIRRLFLLKKRMSFEKENSLFSAMPSAPTTNSSDEVSQAEIGRDITQALAKLPGRQRRVFVLKEIADFKQAEISDILGIPIGTVKSMMHRTVKQLQLDLSKYHTKSQYKGK